MTNAQQMKNKILALAALGAALYSCKNTITPQEKPVIAKTNTEMVPTPPPTAENVAAGKSLYENNCAKCHNLYDPAKYSPEKWVGILNWMAPKAQLDATQKALVYAYVSHRN